MNDYLILPVEGSLRYTFDFTDDLPSASPAITITAVTFSINQSGSPLAPVLGTQTDEFSLNKATIQVSGGVHGKKYVLQALATTTGNETLVKDAVLMGLEG
jgi:hypothetical protein